MLFNSYVFIFLFLPITLIGYFILNRFKLIQLSKGWLTVASLFFYGWWKPDYIPLILFSMIFNYTIGSSMINQEKFNLKINKKLIVLTGIIGNIALLSYYKYFDFLINNLNHVIKSDFNYLSIVLPLGISFFTFTQLAYIVDVYKGEVKETDFINFVLFVTYFPHLIAGPILHHKEMMPQFDKLKSKIFSHKNLAIGIFLFSIGLFKKVFIADGLSEFVRDGYNMANALNFFESWLVSISYAMQIYFDFSGYTDMALGISFMFNIILPQNFNSPYKAHNIQEFWKRWHMTLSRFLRDYVYIPLGGNRLGELATYRNLMLTFLLGGLWHGANWTFVAWGAIHGMASALHKFWQRFNIRMPGFIAVILTFIVVNFAWVFFRAENFDTAINMASNMLGAHGFTPPKIFHGSLRLENIHTLAFFDPTNTLYTIILGFVLLFFKNSNELARNFKPSFLNALLVSILLLIGISSLGQPSEFLYFNF